MELISYATDFVSFFIQNLKEIDNVKSIILFGSVARGEATKNSDVDLFIDVIGRKDVIEKKTITIKDKFLNSVKSKDYWVPLGIKNEINIIVDSLEKWKLKDSMLGNAIILYQKYSKKLEDGKNQIIFSWVNIKPNAKRVMLNKKIYGYNHYGKLYNGILGKYNGKKIGSNVIILDVEWLNEAIKIFRQYKVSVKILRVFEYAS